METIFPLYIRLVFNSGNFQFSAIYSAGRGSKSELTTNQNCIYTVKPDNKCSRSHINQASLYAQKQFESVAIF